MSNPNARLHNALNDLLREVIRLPSSSFMQIDPDVIDAAHAALKAAKTTTEEPEEEEDPDPTYQPNPDAYARLRAYNKAGARIRNVTSWKKDWYVRGSWSWSAPVEAYEVHPDDLHLVPAYDPAKNNGAESPADENKKL